MPKLPPAAKSKATASPARPKAAEYPPAPEVPALQVNEAGSIALGAAAARVLQNQIQAIYKSAAEFGVSSKEILKMLSRETRPYLEAEIREGYATPEEGLAELLTAERGCADSSEARMLFHKPNGVSRQALSERIRAGDLIAYQTGGDRWVLPRWQFRPEGGLLPGLPEVLARIRGALPQASPLFPFTFFLQADPVCGGRTPLQALRDGDLDTVLRAVDGHAV